MGEIIMVAERTYLEIVQFLVGAFNSMYPWIIFGMLTLAATIGGSPDFWLSFIGLVCSIIMIARFGALWERDYAKRRAAISHLSNDVSHIPDISNI